MAPQSATHTNPENFSNSQPAISRTAKAGRILLWTFATLFLLFYLIIALLFLHPEQEKIISILESTGKLSMLEEQKFTSENLLVHISQLVDAAGMQPGASLYFTRRLQPAATSTSHSFNKKFTDTILNLDPINKQLSLEPHTGTGLTAVDSLNPAQSLLEAGVKSIPGQQILSDAHQLISTAVEKREEQVAEGSLEALPDLQAEFDLLKKNAVASNKLYVLQFGASWCLPCRQLEAGVMKDKAVLKALAKDFLLLKIDIEDFEGFNLKNQFEVQQIPSLLIFNGHDVLLKRHSGSLGCKELLHILQVACLQRNIREG